MKSILVFFLLLSSHSYCQDERMEFDNLIDSLVNIPNLEIYYITEQNTENSFRSIGNRATGESCGLNFGYWILWKHKDSIRVENQCANSCFLPINHTESDTLWMKQIRRFFKNIADSDTTLEYRYLTFYNDSLQDYSTVFCLAKMSGESATKVLFNELLFDYDTLQKVKDAIFHDATPLINHSITLNRELKIYRPEKWQNRSPRK